VAYGAIENRAIASAAVAKRRYFGPALPCRNPKRGALDQLLMGHTDQGNREPLKEMWTITAKMWLKRGKPFWRFDWTIMLPILKFGLIFAAPITLTVLTFAAGIRADRRRHGAKA
jgi:hypothetical protein